MNNVQSPLQAVKHSSQQAASAHETSILAYNGSNITFELSNGEVMVNLTEMAKAFGKRPNDFLGLPSTAELIKAITRKFGIDENQAVSTIRGGSNPGTWANRLVALSFAQWLSVDFHLICLEKIEELLTQGVATINNDDETILHAMKVLEQRVQASKQRIQALEGEVEHQQAQISVLAPKAEYTDRVLNATGTLTTNQIAQELGMSAIRLNSELKNRGVLYKQGKQWLLTAKYRDKGLISIRTYIATNPETGEQKTYNNTVWTEKGRKFIHTLF